MLERDVFDGNLFVGADFCGPVEGVVDGFVKQIFVLQHG